MTLFYLSFSGAGGTGKTSVINLLQKKIPTLPYSVAVMLSPTRSVYKEIGPSFGVTNEQEYVELPYSRQLEFQKKMADEVWNRMTQFARDNTDKDIVLFERSAFDNYAYLMADADFNEEDSPYIWYESSIWAFFNGLAELSRDVHGEDIMPVFVTMEFSFPTPWSTLLNKDGFRKVHFSKDLRWAMILRGMHYAFREFVVDSDTVDFTYDFFTVGNGMPEERTEEVLEEMRRGVEYIRQGGLGFDDEPEDEEDTGWPVRVDLDDDDSIKILPDKN